MSAAVLTGQDQSTRHQTAVDIRLAIADGLTAHDLDVLDPAGEGSQYLKVTNAHNALCEILISESGSVTWEYRPFTGTTGAAQITNMVLELLGAIGSENRSGSSRQGTGPTLTSIVGPALGGCGMRIQVAEAGRDDDHGGPWAEIVVINPARPDRGTARVGDDGMIRWECHLSDPAASIRGLSPDEIAGTSARALMQAKSQ